MTYRGKRRVAPNPHDYVEIPAGQRININIRQPGIEPITVRYADSNRVRKLRPAPRNFIKQRPLACRQVL